MNLVEFEQQRALRPCGRCGATVVTHLNPNNNGLQVVCDACGSRAPWGAALFLKQSEQKRRPPLPEGKTLAEVWTAFDDRCVSCGRTREVLREIGVGCHVHHVVRYVEQGHAGPVVPLCAHCHQIVTALQRAMSALRIVRESSDAAGAESA